MSLEDTAVWVLSGREPSSSTFYVLLDINRLMQRKTFLSESGQGKDNLVAHLGNSLRIQAAERRRGEVYRIKGV